MIYELSNREVTVRKTHRCVWCGEAISRGEMAQYAVKICELPEEYQLYVLSVSISYSDEDIQGLVITCHRALKYSNAPLIINTPHFSREPYSESADPEASVFSTECADDLDELERLAFAYLDGDRAQTSLGLEETEEPEESAPVTI